MILSNLKPLFSSSSLQLCIIFDLRLYNEIAIIDEAIERMLSEKISNNEILIMELRERRAKALALKEIKYFGIKKTIIK